VDILHDLGRLNSLTKYPSILTYHDMSTNAGQLAATWREPPRGLLITEKIHGTNGRMVILPDGDFLLGTREEFTYARGDRIGNPAEGVLAALKDTAARVADLKLTPYHLVVVFGEVFGRSIGGWGKNYGSHGKVGFRVFDVMAQPTVLAQSVLEMPRDRISLWRQHGNQPFLPETDLQEWCAAAGLDLAPRLGFIDSLPTDHRAVLEWLDLHAPRTQVALDDTAFGEAEGVVVRSLDRSYIAKIRFEDYHRTLRVRPTCPECGMQHKPGKNSLCSR
jgi:hypothetical protein